MKLGEKSVGEVEKEEWRKRGWTGREHIIMQDTLKQ